MVAPWGTDTQSALAGLSTDFRNEMGNFQKQMVVYANAKILEQYQKLMSDLLEQIDRQNRAIEQQTEMAALGAGFVRSGNVYIKQSKLVSSAVGMVEAYQWFDGKGAFDRFISSVGGDSGGALLRDKNGGMVNKSRDEIMADLPSFLEAADTVQVESFFAVQKLILQHAFEKIMGTGTVSERKNSRDKEVIGELAWWIGKPAGSSEKISSGLDEDDDLKGYADAKVQEAIASAISEDNASAALDILKYVNDPGFGELGDGGNRPSGIYLGFYNKLDLVNRYIDGKDSDRMERMAGAIDPLTATINQFNPVVMLANAVQNVRVASEVYGRDAGYMWEAQVLGAAKTPLRVVGSLLVAAGTAVMAAAGWTGIGVLVGGVVIGAGALVSATANSIHVDAKTGKRSYQMTDEGALATVTDVVGGALGGYASYAAKASNVAAAAQAANTTAETIRAAETALATAQTAKNLALGGSAVMGLVQSGAEFDSSGRYTGYWSLGGARGDAALTSTVASALSAEAAGAMGLKQGTLASDLTKSGLSTGMNMMVQYQKMLAGHENSYAAMAEADFSDLGGKLGTVMQSQSQDWQNQLANSLDRTHRASDSMAGLGVFGRRDEKGNLVYDGPVADDEYKFGDGIKSTLAGYAAMLGFGKGGLWEMTANWLGWSGQFEQTAVLQGRLDRWLNGLTADQKVALLRGQLAPDEAPLKVDGSAPRFSAEDQANIWAHKKITLNLGGQDVEFKQITGANGQNYFVREVVKAGNGETIIETVNFLPDGTIRRIIRYGTTTGQIGTSLTTEILDGQGQLLSKVNNNYKPITPAPASPGTSRPQLLPEDVPLRGNWSPSLPAWMNPLTWGSAKSPDDFSGHFSGVDTGGTGVERSNRIIAQIRAISEKEKFRNQTERNNYIAAVALKIGKELKHDNPPGQGILYGFDWEVIKPDGTPDIDLGKLDCSNTGSLVLFAAGVTEADPNSDRFKNSFALYGEYHLSSIDKLRRSLNENPKVGEDGNKWYRGGTNFRYSGTVLEQVSKPVPGAFGTSYLESGGYTDHVYVVTGINKDGSIQIMQSGGGYNGINIQDEYHLNVNGRRDTFFVVRRSFNSDQFH